MIYVDPISRAYTQINNSPGTQENNGQIITICANENLSNSRIELADMNRDSLADYLIIYRGCTVKAFLNNGALLKHKEGKRIQRDNIIILIRIADNDGRNVRLVDLNGDGFADYLVLWDGGTVDTYMNQQHIPPIDGQ